MSRHSNDRAIGLRMMAVGIVASLSAGCGYLIQARDHANPVAVSAMRDAQTLNPEAGRNRKAVVGLEGSAGGNVGNAYATSFVSEETRLDANEVFQGTAGLSQD